jgi:chloramphenicol-sensitive protein RarD
MLNVTDLKNKDSQSIGIIFILLTYTVWGIQSLYWNIFKDLSPSVILCYRILWSSVFALIYITANKKFGVIKEIIANKTNLLLLLGSSFTIGLNWLLNIYAVSSNHLIEASFGHFITPIASIIIAVLFLKEKLKRVELLSALLIVIGVSLLIINLGYVPLLAILLVVTFVVYTIIKKKIKVDPIMSVVTEILILTPFALIYFLVNVKSDISIFNNFEHMASISTMGLFTLIPLFMFSFGVHNVNLTKIGFIQYYAPTLSLLIGIFMFNEPFKTEYMISFSIIWFAILIIVSSSIKNMILKKA